MRGYEPTEDSTEVKAAPECARRSDRARHGSARGRQKEDAKDKENVRSEALTFILPVATDIPFEPGTLCASPSKPSQIIKRMLVPARLICSTASFCIVKKRFYLTAFRSPT